ncbi:unnamed protein product [Laminaria digitata]
MCTPSLAIDTVVEVTDPETREVVSVLVVRRRDNGKLACIGGFVNVGETLQEAAKREVLEETGLEVSSLRMIPQVYDEPSRDTRRHTVSVAFVAQATGVPTPGSEEEAVVSIPLSSLRDRLGEFAFDHGAILTDYLASGLTVVPGDDLVWPVGAATTTMQQPQQPQQQQQQQQLQQQLRGPQPPPPPKDSSAGSSARGLA